MTEGAEPADQAADGVRHRSGLLHGRRAGRPLRKQQRARFDRALPGLELAAAGPIEPATLFEEPKTELRMEIGFGGGEHLVAEAERQADVGFIGCEPFRNGVAKLLERIEALGLRNLRIHAGDAAEVLDRLPDGCLARVDLLYPDPWPKRRQRKRRFISDANVERLGRVLRPGAEVRFATDIDDYAGWGLAHLIRSPWFDWPAAKAEAWRTPWQPWSSTRYEGKAIREGRPPVYLTFVRRSAPEGP